jgi:hypothetical protein
MANLQHENGEESGQTGTSKTSRVHISSSSGFGRGARSRDGRLST